MNGHQHDPPEWEKSKSSEAILKKEKALLEQKVELLKIELGEISERATNQAKMYELMLKVFKSNSENSNIDHLIKEFEKNKYLIENSTSDESRYRSPEVWEIDLSNAINPSFRPASPRHMDRIRQLEKENQHARDRIK